MNKQKETNLFLDIGRVRGITLRSVRGTEPSMKAAERCPREKEPLKVESSWEGSILSWMNGWRKETRRQVSKKNSFAVQTASLGGLCRRLVSRVRSRGPSTRDEMSASGIPTLRLGASVVRLKADPLLLRP